MPTSSHSRQARRHNPLLDDLNDTGRLRQVSGSKRKQQDDDEKEDDGNREIDSRTSRKILKIGRDLAEEDEEEEQEEKGDIAARNGPPGAAAAFTLESRFVAEEGQDHDRSASEDEEAWGDEEDVDEDVEVDPADLDTFNKLMGISSDLSMNDDDDNAQGTSTNLADLILEKIAAHEAGIGAEERAPTSKSNNGPHELPPKVVEVFSRIGILLSRYKSGKLPKLFKILPTLPDWREILYVTRPEQWTPNACYEATRIFVSGKPLMTQVFLEEVVLPRVRENIHETRKLNVHLYNALKKSLYKPAAFFKGFLFPLVASGSCTLREAHIVASVLARVSVPVLHSAAALLRLCDMAAEQASAVSTTEAGGATNVFIRVLLEKKYALPYKVIDALVFHFLRFRGAQVSLAAAAAVAAAGTGAGAGAAAPAGIEGRLPVLWHQCLLAFAQRYRNDITEDQREALLDLLLVKGHSAIGPEVRRELLEGRGRGVPAAQQPMEGGDDTMLIDEVPVSAPPAALRGANGAMIQV